MLGTVRAALAHVVLTADLFVTKIALPGFVQVVRQWLLLDAPVGPNAGMIVLVTLNVWGMVALVIS